MSVKIPSSMKWLAGKYRTLHDQVVRSQQQLTAERAVRLFVTLSPAALDVDVSERLRRADGQIAALESKLERNRAALASLEIAFGLHRIQVNPKSITPGFQVTSPAPRREVADLILDALRDAGNFPASTSNLCSTVIEKLGGPNIPEVWGPTMLSVTINLKTLARKGQVVRVSLAGDGDDATWMARDQDTCQPRLSSADRTVSDIPAASLNEPKMPVSQRFSNSHAALHAGKNGSSGA